MEEDHGIMEQASKFSRVGNRRNDSMEIVQRGSDDEEDRDKRAAANGVSAGKNPLRVWHPSSRIIRVSRATGGKDRHSKVWTSKGLRDRRVRLSVTTAIQFYDLQDRLGYDQPSKAVEWLIKAAADSISELPSLNSSFPDTPKQMSDEKRASEGTDQQGPLDSAEIESETSKNSSLSLSRSDQKKKSSIENHQNVNPIPPNSSFTELLTGGIGSSVGNNNNATPAASAHQNNPNGEPDFFHKANTGRQWPVSQMDYFTSGLLGPPSSRTSHHFSGFLGQIQLVNSLQQSSIPPFTVSSDQSHHHHHQELQHFAFVPNPDQHLTQPEQGGHDYNLNFTISTSLAGFNKGTLQSNSPSFLPHHHHHQLHRFSSSVDGLSPFYISPTQPVENHHHNQFFYGGDGNRCSDQKGKGKN